LLIESQLKDETKTMRKFYNLILLSVIILFGSELKAQVNTQDSLALVDLYNSTDGVHWYTHTNWLTSSPLSTWYGVTLTDGRITTLYLSGNALSGSLPSSIGKLTSLDVLDLSGNRLVDSIPASIGNLINLTQLNFSANHLSGKIPTSLSKLANLWNLNFGANQLSGNIPSSLSKLKNLYLLLLSVNNLSGSIPSSLGNLTNLGALELYDNQLNGSVPSALGKLNNLVELTLSYNQLSGNISFVNNLRALSYLDLSSNEFSGNISFLGKLDTLGYVDLSKNQLTGNIPVFVQRALPFGLSLNLSNNKFTGRISSQFDSLSDIIYVSLRLSNNQLSGTIPYSLNKLTGLGEIDFSSNEFNGKIPSFDSLKNLQYLNLSHNQFNGMLPASIKNLHNLITMDVSCNQLYGQIPPFSKIDLPHLIQLELDSNKFSFAGMENIATIFPFAVYSPQANISITQNGNVLKVVAGGTLSNNTYKWYKNGVLYKTKTGNASLTVDSNGNYSVAVTNAIATQLTLYSDTVAVTNLLQQNNLSAIAATSNNFSIYPNPVKSIATISFTATGNYTIQLSDVSGNILQEKTIHASGKSIVNFNLSKYSGGVYFVSLISEGKPTQSLQVNKE